MVDKEGSICFLMDLLNGKGKYHQVEFHNIICSEFLSIVDENILVIHYYKKYNN